MILSDLVHALKGAATLVITVKDANEGDLIKFYTGGENCLTAELLARTVTTVKVENATAVTVELEKETTP
jgi:hypothetical protein